MDFVGRVAELWPGFQRRGVHEVDANQVSTATLTGTLPINGLRKTQYYGCIQDEFKWKPNFNINIGVRYSFFNIFHEVLGRANPFDFATCGPQGYCGVGASFGRPNTFDIDPPIALAWSPGNNAETVIRAGFGIYHEDGQSSAVWTSAGYFRHSRLRQHHPDGEHDNTCEPDWIGNTARNTIRAPGAVLSFHSDLVADSAR